MAPLSSNTLYNILTNPLLSRLQHHIQKKTAQTIKLTGKKFFVCLCWLPIDGIIFTL